VTVSKPRWKRPGGGADPSAATQSARAKPAVASLGPQAISAELRENAQINAGIARGELREAQAEAKMAQINLDRSQVHAPRNVAISPTCAWPKALCECRAIGHGVDRRFDLLWRRTAKPNRRGFASAIR
jgi:hypothetical protein